MNKKYARTLSSPYLIEKFLGAIGYEGTIGSTARLIFEGEKDLVEYGMQNNSVTSFEFRDGKYRDETDRWKLRTKIVEELFTLKRLSKDDTIRLGKGGALPICDVQNNKQAMILIGLPASGKSSIAHEVSDNYGAIILDSDFGKRKFPEYKRYKYGASLLHEESDIITMFSEDVIKPKNFRSLIERCILNSSNIVIPKIGYNADSIEKLAEKLKLDLGYDVHLTLVSLDRRKATLRAINRYKQSKRYVSIGLIFDGYSNDPTLTYFRLKQKNTNLFSSFGEISTDVPYRTPPICIEFENNNPAHLYKTSL
ncbi:MAG: zeta toxin family protein [Gammaproteobacteria bacterium]|nr:zeta toxin family protein [Gammaproteobacteria bacterium]